MPSVEPSPRCAPICRATPASLARTLVPPAAGATDRTRDLRDSIGQTQRSAMKCTVLALTSIAVLALVAFASAAVPSQPAVWTQASAEWRAQAIERGAPARCTPLRQIAVLGMVCDFGARGSVSVSRPAEPCVYLMRISKPRGGGLPARFMTSVRAEFNPCQRGWLNALPAPWTISR